MDLKTFINTETNHLNKTINDFEYQFKNSLCTDEKLNIIFHQNQKIISMLANISMGSAERSFAIQDKLININK